VPESHPGVDERPGFLRVRGPSGRGGGSGLGRADHSACVARRPALAFGTRGRQLRACGRAEETPDHLDVGGEVTSEGLGRRAAIGRHAESAWGACRRDVVDDAASQGTARAIGALECVRERFLARACEANGAAQVVAGPAREGDAHDRPDHVDPPQGALCLSGGTGTVAGVRSALDMTAGLLHGGIIKADSNDGIRGYE
jgi:hypothetical protein